jgi:hypothetical protein
MATTGPLKPALAANLAEQLRAPGPAAAPPASVTIHVPVGATVTVTVSSAPAILDAA